MSDWEFRKQDPSTWHPQQKWLDYILRWAESHGNTFVIEDYEWVDYDIDGMEVVDVWGWLMPEDNAVQTDERYGLLQWYMEDGAIKLYWNQNPAFDEGPPKNYSETKEE